MVDAAGLLPADAEAAARKAMPYLCFARSCPDDDVDEELPSQPASGGGGSGGSGGEGSIPGGGSKGGSDAPNTSVVTGTTGKGGSSQKQPFCDCSRLIDLPAEEGDEARRSLLLWMRRTGGHLPVLQTGGEVAVTFRLSSEVAAASNIWHTVTVSLSDKGSAGSAQG